MNRCLHVGIFGGLATLLAVAPVACAGSDSNKPTTTTPVTTAPGLSLKATEREYAITLNEGTLRAGAIRVTAANTGTIEHELVAFRTDLDETELPLDSGKVDEDGAGIVHIDPEAENVKPGTSKTIALNLTAGRYVFICNLPGHYQLGMHAVLTVR